MLISWWVTESWDPLVKAMVCGREGVASHWSEISQLIDRVPLSNCLIYCMWQLFPSYVFKACFCILWETKFGHCYWAGLRCVKISIRSSGVKTFMTCPLVPSHFIWWCEILWFLILPCLVLPSTASRLLDPALQCFLFPYPVFLVWCIFFHALWWQWYCLGGKFSGISWINAVHFIYMKIFSVGLTIRGLATLEVLPKLWEY